MKEDSSLTAMKTALSTFHSWLSKQGASLKWNGCVTGRLGIDKQATHDTLYMSAYTCTCEHMEKHAPVQLPSYVTHKHLPVTASTTKQTKNCIASFWKVEFIAGLDWWT